MPRKSNRYTSFILQVSLLLAVMVGLTTFLLYRLNVRAEAAIQEKVDEHFGALAEAVHVTLASMPTSMWLPEFIQQHPIHPHFSRVVHLIFITDSRHIITDSTNPVVLGKELVSAGPLPDPEHQISFEELISQTQPSEPREMRYYNFPVVTGNSQGTEEERIHVLLSWGGIPDILTETSRNRLLAMAGMLIATMLLLIWLVWRFTRPIDDLLRAERQVARGDLDVQLQVRHRDEIGSLAETFNEMVNALKRNRQLEERLREVEQAAAIGRLASGIAHEIRNPLNFINLSIDHVRSRFRPAVGDGTQFEKLLDSIKSEVARLNRLVTDFLSYGRPTRISPQSIDLPRLVDDVLSPLAAQAEEQQVQIVVESDAILPEIQADAELVKICLSNLFINALQAMPMGGQLKVALTSQGNGVTIAVSDTGIGIAPEHLDKIFEPYYSNKETGIGLGLALTKKLVQDHGGTITVRSQPDQGSTFTITLPQAHRQASEPGELTVSGRNNE
ncbi:MAG: HAMP domain-containing protein [Acidobacteria bacterium]|nr:HAMP domain-containing protein [Acidobacteriota bacterium]